jgi:hypothetical protein
MRRRLVACALAVTCAVVLPACANKDDQKKQLRTAVLGTQHLPNQFLYEVQTPDGTQTVQGIVEDDFRFKARVIDDDQPAFDEAVRDDGLAVRFNDDTKVNSFIRPSGHADALAPTDFNGVTVHDALESGHWVVDKQGAPVVAAAAAADAKLGQDPVVDALTALDYVQRAANDSAGVKLFDPEAVNPVYRADEDNFPKPQKGSGVLRYDLAKPVLPPVSQVGAGGEAAFPQTKHFRRMAVYVKDGRVIDVREEVNLKGRSLDDFIKYFRAALKESKASKSIVKNFERYIKTTSRAKQSTGLLEFLNEGLKQQGLQPIAVRNMSLELRDLGHKQNVTMPDTGVVYGTLKSLTIARAPAATTTDDNASDTTETSDTTDTSQLDTDTSVP